MGWIEYLHEFAGFLAVYLHVTLLFGPRQANLVLITYEWLGMRS